MWKKVEEAMLKLLASLPLKRSLNENNIKKCELF